MPVLAGEGLEDLGVGSPGLTRHDSSDPVLLWCLPGGRDGIKKH